MNTYHYYPTNTQRGIALVDVLSSSVKNIALFWKKKEFSKLSKKKKGLSK